MTRNVICMKWGTKFDASYVNRLHAMVQKHLTLPHRFVCFTDDDAGFNEGIESRPLPFLDLPQGLPERGWNKLTTFKAPLEDLEGQALFLDLDLIILGSLNEFFEYPGEVCIIKEWPKRLRDQGIGNSSIYRFEVNKHPDILDHFIHKQDEVRAEVRNEQAYLSKYMLKKGALSYWPEGWCVSFKRQCMHSLPASLFKEPEFPKDAKAVIFHGNPNPDDAIQGKSGKWFRPMKPCTWIEKHWG